MRYQFLSPEAWAEREFGSSQLGDKRLNRRVVQVATAMAADPLGSIPKQNKQWSHTKGAYRLFDNDRASFESISEAHWEQTRRECSQCPVVLLIQDTTWLDYTHHPQNQGMGWHGPGMGSGSGLLLHNVLAIAPEAGGTGRAIGLAWGKLWTRRGEPTNKDQASRSRQRRSEDRESLRWSDAVKEIGAAPPGVRWLHVGDRESDLFHLYEQTRQLQGVGFVIRVSKDRNATAGHNTPATVNIQQRKSKCLKALCRSMPKLGQTKLWLPPKAGRAGRWATLNLAAQAMTIWSPQLNRTGRALRCWVVRVWEPKPPSGIKPIEWMLLCSEPVLVLEDALRITGYYGLRWLIEEYHQCLKSGCGVEDRQLETAERLSPLIGMLCVVAVRLLQLKNDSRLTPEKPASKCVPNELVQTLAKLMGVKSSTLTVHRFTHEVAKLGGFIGRKSDGEPGWRTLWRGWHELSLINAGRQLAERGLGCG